MPREFRRRFRVSLLRARPFFTWVEAMILAHIFMVAVATLYLILTN